MNTVVEKEDIANLIRNYVHYDNLASNFQKQTQNARIVRDDFERRIIHELKAKNMENAVIQIVGGKLKIIEEKHNAPLSFKSLESTLQQYYQSKKMNDDTSNVLKFVKEHREFEVVSKLKKIPQLPPQPGNISKI